MMAPKTTREPNRTRAAPLRAFASEQQADVAGAWLLGALGDPAAEAYAARAGAILQRAHGEGTGVAGAFLVPSAVSAAIINVRERYGSFRANAQIVAMPTDNFTAPRRTADLTASFVAENATITEQQSSWDGIGLIAKKLGILVKTSNERAQDATIDLASEIFSQIGHAFARKEDDCGWNGDGTSVYGGIRGVTQLLIDGQHDASKVAAAAGHSDLTKVDVSDLGI